MARRFGIPAFSPAGVPDRRRFPVKALALAALFLAIAAVAALVVSGQLRHRRIVNAEEPIGKPIGVPEAYASVTPVTANTNAIASNIAPPTTAEADSTSVQSAPPTNAESSPTNVPPVSTDRVVMASTVQAAVTPAPPAVSDPPKNPPSQEPASVAANNSSALPAATDPPRDVASSKPAEPTPGESPAAESAVVAQQTESEKITMREVRRAEPADDEPEVRRAEPAPPEEGPETAAAEATPPPEAEPRVPAKSPAKKTERTAKPKRPAEKKSYSSQPTSDRATPRSQQRSGRARLVGVTPEGWWMLELPSNKIIIVPPPPSSR